MSRKDEIREQLFDDLINAIENAKDLDVQEVIWHGISFFTQMAIDCAPSVTTARRLINEASKSIKKETV